MTMPHLQNCQHQGSGWCLTCVGKIVAQRAALVEALKAHEQWEAELIMSNEAWDDGMATFPTLTQDLCDKLTRVQNLRNAALAQAKVETPWDCAHEKARSAAEYLAARGLLRKTGERTWQRVEGI